TSDAKILVAGLAGEFGRPHPIVAPEPRKTPSAGVRTKVYFVRDASTIGPKAAPLLEEVAKTLRARPAMRLRVDGHADANETKPAALSLGRAEGGKHWRVGLGTPGSQLETHGAGAAPAGQESPNREDDRRADFTVLDGGDAP